jgi:hypothetical protein
MTELQREIRQVGLTGALVSVLRRNIVLIVAACPREWRAAVNSIVLDFDYRVMKSEEGSYHFWDATIGGRTIHEDDGSELSKVIKELLQPCFDAIGAGAEEEAIPQDLFMDLNYLRVWPPIRDYEHHDDDILTFDCEGSPVVYHEQLSQKVVPV